MDICENQQWSHCAPPVCWVYTKWDYTTLSNENKTITMHGETATAERADKHSVTFWWGWLAKRRASKRANEHRMYDVSVYEWETRALRSTFIPSLSTLCYFVRYEYCCCYRCYCISSFLYVWCHCNIFQWFFIFSCVFDAAQFASRENRKKRNGNTDNIPVRTTDQHSDSIS